MSGFLNLNNPKPSKFETQLKQSVAWRLFERGKASEVLVLLAWVQISMLLWGNWTRSQVRSPPDGCGFPSSTGLYLWQKCSWLLKRHGSILKPSRWIKKTYQIFQWHVSSKIFVGWIFSSITVCAIKFYPWHIMLCNFAVLCYAISLIFWAKFDPSILKAHSVNWIRWL